MVLEYSLTCLEYTEAYYGFRSTELVLVRWPSFVRCIVAVVYHVLLLKYWCTEVLL